MSAVDVTLALPSEVYRSAEHAAMAAQLSVQEFLVHLVGTQIRSEQDELAIEGYQALAQETLEFAASAVATVRETWPEYRVRTSRPNGTNLSLNPVARSTCRSEILAAIPAIVARNASDEFTMQEVVDELRTRGTHYAETTIRTHVGSRMCANARQNHATKFDDLERLDHGVYRLRSTDHDKRTAGRG